MAAIDFPDPAVTNPFTDPNDKIWDHDGEGWRPRVNSDGGGTMLHAELTDVSPDQHHAEIHSLFTHDDVADVVPDDGERLTYNAETLLWEPRRSTSALGIVAFNYRWTSPVSTIPSPGRLSTDNADPTLVTVIYVSRYSDGDGNPDQSLYFENMGAGNWFNIAARTDSTQKNSYDLIASPTLVGDVWNVPVTFYEQGGAVFGDNDRLLAVIRYTQAPAVATTTPTGFKNVLLNGDFRVNQRGFDGNWVGTNPLDYGYDGWFYGSDALINQEIEDMNLINGATYTLAWSGGGTGFIYDGDLSTIVTGATGIFGSVTVGANPIRVSVPTTATNIQLERGSVQTDFEVRNIQQELLMCQRLARSFSNTDTNISPIISTGGYAIDTGSVMFMIPIVEMRYANIALEYSGTFLIVGSDGSHLIDAITIVETTASMIKLQATTAQPVTLGQCYALGGQGACDFLLVSN